MLKAILASSIIGATSTVSIVELYSWNSYKSEIGDAEVPQVVNAYNVDGNSAYMEQNKHFIKYLKMEIDGMDHVRVLSESNVPGEWSERTRRFGAKLYYEIKDHEGHIISTGYRADPRNEALSNDMRQTYPFVVSLPYMADADSISFYRLSDDYSKDDGMGFDYVKLDEYSFNNRL